MPSFDYDESTQKNYARLKASGKNYIEESALKSDAFYMFTPRKFYSEEYLIELLLLINRVILFQILFHL